MRRYLIAIAVAGALVASNAQAQSADRTINDTTAHTRSPDLSLMAWLPWYYGFGIGLDIRYEIPILPDGFIPNVNDEFTIEPCLGLAFANYGYANLGYNYVDIAPSVFGVWGFHVLRNLRLYGALGLGYNVVSWTGNGPGNTWYPVYWDAAVGMNYKFASNMSFRGELGSMGLKAGLSIYF